MKIGNFLIGLLLIVGVAGAGFFSYNYYKARHRQCQICGRPIYPKMQATAVLKDKSQMETCCPRCALHAYVQRPSEVERIAVADYNGGEAIPAEKATFVEGSDVECCRPDPGAAPREPGVEYDLKFDRCAPGLHAFKTEAAALDFQRQYHGRMLNFAQALESVRHH
jgi:nitrous oxide reductase accessory protein NosL